MGIKVKNRTNGKSLLGNFLKTDRRFRIYLAVFFASIVLLIIGSVILSSPAAKNAGLAQNMGVYLFAPSIIVFPASAYALSYRMRVLNAQAREPGSFGDESFYTVSTDWSKVKAWPWFLSGLALITIAVIFAEFIPSLEDTVGVIFISGFVLIALGLFLLYLRALSR